MARRGRGEGAVYRRSDGRWEAQLRLRDGRRTSLYARSRRRAIEKLADAGWRVDHGLPLHAAKRRLGDYLDYWLEVTRHRVRPTTLEAYELNVRRLQPHLGSLPLARLEAAVIQAAYDRLLKAGLSERSVEQMHSVLHRALYQAMHWGLIASNPTELVAPPRPRKREMTALTLDQLQRLLATTKNERWYPLWVILSTAGLRIGEALAVGWESVNLETQRLAVVRSLQRRRGLGLVFAEPKTARSRRSIYLSVVACQALREHRQRQQRLVASRPGWLGSGLVFANRLGGPQDSGSVTSALNRALLRAGLPHVRVHDLRHTTASVLLAGGANPKVVQDLLGHSSVLTTLNTYSHVTQSLSHLAAGTIDHMLGLAGLSSAGGANMSNHGISVDSPEPSYTEFVVGETPLLRQLNGLDRVLDYLERMNLHAQTNVSETVTDILGASGLSDTRDLKPMALIPIVLDRQQRLRRQLSALRRPEAT